jgi:hypothetical protein
MIEVILITSVKPDNTQQSINSYRPLLVDHYDDWHSFFKKLVEQNIILNRFRFLGIFQISKNMKSSYFVESAEKAQIFIDALFDYSAEFSPARLLDENGLKLEIEQKEVTTDVTFISTTLFDMYDNIWAAASLRG